ncbi:hypothetical protein [Massilia sp. YIM B04103]|uniref:hypothetical protein n=1 Tax=Massilia sp. YIM B04103 TaxID=2963106 RepID=UPI00210EA555|nr:hypothetical protein [Massilia sp. YIM B04103]
MILWGKEHRARGEALAAACGETAREAASLEYLSDGIQPVRCSDSTLSIWGHGDAISLAEMLDVELGKLIHSWRKLNPELHTVELVTCDAQHNQQPLAGYARRVASFVEREYQDVTIKALPRGQHSDDYSVLWASNATRVTFCYITAPSKATLAHASARMKALAPGKQYDLSLVAAEMAKERTLVEPTNFSVLAGADLSSLRNMLGVVRAV